MGGEKMEAVTNIIFLGSRFTADDDCSHEIKSCLLLGRKAMTKNALKSRDITLPTKVCIVKTIVFPVVMYGCESWTIKKAEHQRIDAFKLWCWTRCLRVFWATRRSNQSILKDWIFIGSSDTEAEAPILWPPDPKTWLIGKDLDAGKDWRQEEKRGRQRIRWLDDIIDTTDRSLSKLQEIVKDGMPGMLQSMGSQSQTASQSVQSLGHVRLFVSWTSITASASASASVLPMNIQDWFPLGLTGWISLQSKGLSRVFSNTTVQKHEFFSTQLSLWSNSQIHP